MSRRLRAGILKLNKRHRTPGLIKNKSTASGGETPKGSAVPGVHLSHRDLGHMNGTYFRRGLWDCGSRLKTVLGECAIRRRFHDPETSSSGIKTNLR